MKKRANATRIQYYQSLLHYGTKKKNLKISLNVKFGRSQKLVSNHLLSTVNVVIGIPNIPDISKNISQN